MVRVVKLPSWWQLPQPLNNVMSTYWPCVRIGFAPGVGNWFASGIFTIEYQYIGG